MRADVGQRIGIADIFQQDGNQADSIAAVGNLSADWLIVVNGAGAFIYGGTIPGTNLSGNSDAGRILTLLHELAHVAGLFTANDNDPDLNARNNTAVLQNCRKTVLGN